MLPVQKNSDALGQERALEANERGGGQASGGNDGLGWLTEAASKDTAATTPTTPSAPDWLADAKSRGTTKHNKRSTAAKRASIGSAAPGGWMSSGKLGLSTGDDDSDEDQAGKTGRGSAKSRKKKKKQQSRGSVSAAGWLSSGALGVPAQDESDEDGDDSDGGRPSMVTTETQTEDNIEGASKSANGPKLPPWAKPWTPPSPEAGAETDTAPDPPSEQVNISTLRCCRIMNTVNN